MAYKDRNIKRNCVVCGAEFQAKTYHQKCCDNPECKRINSVNWCREWRKNHKEDKKEYAKKYYEKNKKDIAEKFKIWAEKNKNYRKEYYKQKSKERYNTDLNFKIRIWCRNQILRCISDIKKEHTFDILNYTTEQFKQRIEFQFKPDMNWDNHGVLWHIDHKKPISLFNFKLPDNTINYHQIFLANCLANLQPMYAKENLSKKNKFNI